MTNGGGADAALHHGVGPRLEGVDYAPHFTAVA
jgi:hypothetical protein